MDVLEVSASLCCFSMCLVTCIYFMSFYISKMNKYSIDEDTPNATNRIGSYRYALPTHITFKIQLFSLLKTTSMEEFESNEFEVGGYKWKLVFYPNGNNTTSSTTSISSSSRSHISMYLKIVGTDSLPRGWVIDVSFRFFVLDQIRDKYLILGDMGGRTRRFNEMKTIWGYDKLLPLTSLNDSSNGYIVDDTCVFGAEVFPCKNTGFGNCLTMVKSPSCFKYTWKIENFSKLNEEIIYSDAFISEGYEWKIQLRPKGESRGNNENLSLFISLNGSSNHHDQQVYARYKVRVKNQLHVLHKEFENTKWFIPQGCWGSVKMIRLDELNNDGYLVNDTCIIEAEVTVLGALKILS